MNRGKASISHVVLYCYDFKRMLDFYTTVLGFHLSDIGRARGNEPIPLEAPRISAHLSFRSVAMRRSLLCGAPRAP